MKKLIQHFLEDKITVFNNHLYMDSKSSVALPKYSKYIKVIPPLYNILRMLYHKVYKIEYIIPKYYSVSLPDKFVALLTVKSLLEYNNIDFNHYFQDENSKRLLREFFRKRLLCAFSDKIPYEEIFTPEEIIQQKKCFREYMENYKQATPQVGEFMGFKTILNEFGGSVFIEKYGINDCVSISEKPIIIDCGAFIGDSCYMFKTNTLNPKILAIEPCPINFQVLQKNIELNDLKREVIPLNYAVGAEEGYVDISIPKISSSGTGIISAARIIAGRKIRMTTIDKIVDERDLEKVDIIKMDIEGSELDALMGAQNTIKKFKPLLLISVYHRGEDIFEIPKLIKNIVPEYSMKLKHLEPFQPLMEYILICNPPSKIKIPLKNVLKNGLML